MMPSVSRAAAGALVLTAVAGALFLLDLGRYPLLDPDEARHAEVAREMAGGHGLRPLFLPTLDFRPYREKPAGYYWLVSLGYRAAGVGEAAARGVSALAALATVLALYAWALPRHGVAGALGAGLVASTSAGWFGLARYGNLDMTLTAFVVCGVLAGLAWLERPAPRRPPVAPYVAAGLGVLVKGPLAVALVAGPLALAAVTRRPRPALAELGLARGALIVAGIAALLYAPVAFLDPSYLSAFVATNVRRWSTESPHPAPFYYYLVWVPALLMPWTLVAAPALAAAWRAPARRPLVLWAAFVPALLTLPRGKLATYALSALAPLALIVGPELVRAVRSGAGDAERPLFGVLGWVALAGLGSVAIAALAVHAYPLPTLGRIALVAAALGWSWVLVRLLRDDRVDAVPLVVLGVLLTLYPLAVRAVVPAVAALHSERDAVRLIDPAMPAPVIAFGIRDPSLGFYLREPVIYTSDGALVRDVFAGDGPAFLVTSRNHFAEVESLLGERAHVWYETRRRRLYANRPRDPGGAGVPDAPVRNGST